MALCVRLHRDERGFSMVEAMVAGLVLAVGLFGVAQAVTYGLNTSGLARQRMAAQTMAERQIELARTLNYDNVVLCGTAECLTSNPVAHSSDPDDPDFWIQDGTPPSYDSDGDGPLSYEPLIIQDANPSLLHYQSSVMQGNTSFTVYTYVTWVDSAADGTSGLDDPDGNGDGISEGTNDQKRVTVVVSWESVATGATSQLKITSLFSDGKIPYKGAGGSGSNAAPSVSCPTPAEASPAAGDVSSLTVSFTAIASDPDGSVVQYDWDFGDGTSVFDGGVNQSHTYAAPGTYVVSNLVWDDGVPPRAASNAGLVCQVEVTEPGPVGDDITPPVGSIVINSGDLYTAGTQVGLTLSATDEPGGSGLGTMQFGAVEGAGSCSTFGTEVSYNTFTLYTLPAGAAPGGEGVWTVCVRFIDNAGNVSASYSDTITLDRIPPGAPTGLTITRASNKKSADLQWTAPVPLPSDLSGYRVWRRATTSTVWEQVTCQYIFGSPTKCQDATQDNRTNYEYYVVAVDLAGNESTESNHVTV
jgi:type II secretory pathway pseudopilin PulG